MFDRHHAHSDPHFAILTLQRLPRVDLTVGGPSTETNMESLISLVGALGNSLNDIPGYFFDYEKVFGAPANYP